MKWSLKFFRGKMSRGGTVFPVALTAAHIVISWPRSADVSAPVCFIPFGATMLLGFWTVVTPVSSTFHMSDGESECRSMTEASFSKNNLTLALLNAVALDKLVGSGFLMDSRG